MFLLTAPPALETHILAMGGLLLLEALVGFLGAYVRDIHQAWRNDLRGTHMVYMGSPEREEATFLLLPRATSCI